MTILFGIKNCDTVKKARCWLEERDITYQFHDVRSDGLDQNQLDKWFSKIDWTLLVNKRSTTWKQLDESIRETLCADTVSAVLLDHPTLIKRPVLTHNDAVYVGFKQDTYNNIFSIAQ